MSTEGWNPESLALALKLRGYSKKRAALKLGVPYSSFLYSLRTGSSPRICAFISTIVEEEACNIWPWRYPPQWRKGADSTT